MKNRIRLGAGILGLGVACLLGGPALAGGSHASALGGTYTNGPASGFASFQGSAPSWDNGTPVTINAVVSDQCLVSGPHSTTTVKTETTNATYTAVVHQDGVSTNYSWSTGSVPLPSPCHGKSVSNTNNDPQVTSGTVTDGVPNTANLT